MKLFKWNIADIKPKFPNIVEKFMGKKITDEASNEQEVSIVPSVNIADADKAFEVNVALPGLDKKDVKIEIQNDCLIVSSEKQYENEEKNKNWMRIEYGYASFQRMFQLPEGADQDRIQAEMKNGVLLIIDLRECRGSLDENTIPFFCSYFFNEPVHLFDFYTRETNSTKQFWTYAWVPGERYLERPIYILTSGRTFSGGEELAYDLKHLERNAKKVFVAGSFNSWVTEVECEPGKVSYKFIVDDRWITDPQNPHSITENGYLNSFMLVK